MALRQCARNLSRALQINQQLIGGPRAVCTTGVRWYADGAAGDSADASAKAGWGQTKIVDILKQKAPRAGAWLWCSKDDKVIDAVRKMTKGNVGSLLVFDPSKLDLSKGIDELQNASGEAVVGLVTERDYLTKVVVAGKSSATLLVGEIMTPESVLKTVTSHDTVLAAMGLMIDNNFRHVPVVDGGNYLGMISIRDAVKTMVLEHREEVERLQEYIQGTY